MRRGKLQVLLMSILIVLSCSNGNYNDVGQKESRIPEEAIHPLETTEDLEPLMEEIGQRRIVLLGEASHGTSEFYTWRADITKQLITEKDFELIGVEGDWADAYPLNNYITGGSVYTSAEDVLEEFDRWPQWMWANEEVANLVEWLRQYNKGKAPEEQVAFYGLDVYGIWESLDMVLRYLQNNDPDAVPVARAALACFAPFEKDEFAYARATLNADANCADELAALLQVVQNKLSTNNNEAAFNAFQNMRVAVHAEAYYRAAVRSNVASWNIRDRHMLGTMNDLLESRGEDSKMVVWAHNTHIGDARATTMNDAGLENLGELAREAFGPENVYAVGFGTYSGKVIAASSWGNRRTVMNVPRAQKNSWEWLLHRQRSQDMIIIMDELEELPFFQQRIGHRAIGVEYDPRSEGGNYVPSVLPERYDAFVFIDKSTALHPLD